MRQKTGSEAAKKVVKEIRRATRRQFSAEENFVSEASVYCLLKAHDLIASRAFIVMKAANEFKDKTTAPISFGKPTLPILRSSVCFAEQHCPPDAVRPYGRAG